MEARLIYAQCFGGFYESRWLDYYSIDEELEYLEKESGISLSGKNFEFGIDRDKYFNEVGKRYTKELEGIFQKTLGYDKFTMTFNEVVSPREYNFATDQISYTLSIEEEKKFYEVVREKMTENYDELNRMIKERHTSRDGFSSTMSNNIKAWFDEIEFNDSKPYLACILEYLAEIKLNECKTEHENNIIDETIYETLACNGLCIEDYIIGCDEASKKALQSAKNTL